MQFQSLQEQPGKTEREIEVEAGEMRLPCDKNKPGIRGVPPSARIIELYLAFGEGIVTKTANAYFVSIVADDIIVIAATTTQSSPFFPRMTSSPADLLRNVTPRIKSLRKTSLGISSKLKHSISCVADDEVGTSI